MCSRLLRRRFAVLAALVLATMCVGLAEESFAHTDDGCPVETHCLACRLATGNVAVVSASLPLIQRTADHVERIWAESEQPRSESAAVATPSRAPPLA